jgi:hypothetical protein
VLASACFLSLKHPFHFKYCDWCAGSQVIEEERRRVEELKRRAQDEVRAKWEKGKLRVHTSGGDYSTVVHHGDPLAAAVHHVPCNGSSVSSGGATQSCVIREMCAINSESLNSIGGSDGGESSITESSDAPAER